jgi:diadenosine tetraphosphate (Ap4A) HIT family hydrolase
LPGFEVPGWIVIALRRHTTVPAPLTKAEASGLGEVIRLASASVQEATGAERIYLQSYGENHSHWHLLVSPRGAEIPPEHRHTQLFVNRDRYVDIDQAAAALVRIRRAIDGSAVAADVESQVGEEV